MLDTEKLSRRLPGLSLYRIVVVTSLFVIVYFSFTIAGNAAHSYQLIQQQRDLQRSIATDQAEYAQLTALKQYMQSDRFVEAQAREEGLAMPGDTAIDVSAPAATGTAQPAPPGAWWEKYFSP